MEQNYDKSNEEVTIRVRSKTALVNHGDSKLVRKSQSMNIEGDIKSVAWNPNTLKKSDENKIKKTNSNEKPKIVDWSQRRKLCCLSKNPVKIEGCLIEIIDTKGNISKTMINHNQDEHQNKEFTKTVISKQTGEFSIAQSFFNEIKIKEKEDGDEFNEDIVTNTMRNQFAGKMEVLDCGSAHSLLKTEK